VDGRLRRMANLLNSLLPFGLVAGIFRKHTRSLEKATVT